MVMITPGRVSTAGTNWEQGYAYAKGKQILVDGHLKQDRWEKDGQKFSRVSRR